jgi:integrase
MNSSNRSALLEVVRSQNADVVFSEKRKQWPWLHSISSDGHKWTIADGSGSLGRTTTVSFDIELMDGTNLADRRNKEFYSLAVDYAETFRLFNPECSAATHIKKIKALLGFICWLSDFRIRSLKGVTPEHINSYASNVAYGFEVALQVPKSVFTTVKDAILNDAELPINRDGVFHRHKIQQLAGTQYIFSKKRATAHSYTKSILTWFENQIWNDFNGVDLSSIEYTDVLDSMDNMPTKHTHQHVHTKLLPLEEVWAWSSHMSSRCFIQNPFPEGSSKVALQLGVQCKRTKTIPPKVAFAHLSESVKWILDYAPIIEMLYNDKASPKVVMKALEKHGLKLNVREGDYYVSTARNTVTLEGIVRMLAAACFTTVATLTARRKEEIFDLGAGCVDDRDDDSYWLKIYIEKTSQRYDLVPVPELVNKAIALLERLSEEARTRSGNDSLWQYVSADGEVSSFQITNSLQGFYDLNVKSKTNVEWRFTPHQFRRFFALIYFYRYEGSYIGALSYHLRHFNIEMTRRYITDEGFMKEMNEVAEEWSATFLRGVISGNRKIGGKGGDKIKKKFEDWLSHYRSKVDVVERERVIDKMRRYMKKAGVNLIQHVWGTVCSCPTNTSLANKAKCANENNVPELSNGTEELCGECPFSIYTERYAEEITKDIEARNNTKRFGGEDTILGELAGIQVVSLNKLLERAETITPMEKV